MATCLRVSDHSYNALEQAVLIWPTAEKSPADFTAPLALPLFAQEKALLVVQGDFWVEGRNCWCCKCHLKKNKKNVLIKAEAEQFGHFPWALYRPAPVLQSDTSALAPSLGGSREAGGEKHTAAHPHLKQQGRRVCSFSVFKTLDKSHSRLGKCKNEHPTGTTGCQVWQGWTLRLKEGDWAACQQN